MLSDELVETEKNLHFASSTDSSHDVIIHLDDTSQVKLHSLVLAAFSDLFSEIGGQQVSIV